MRRWQSRASMDSHPLPSGRDNPVGTERQDLREIVDELRQEWKLMWRSRFDDKFRAGKISDTRGGGDC